MAGPFTTQDQWHHAGLVDKIECEKTVRCVKRNRVLLAAVLAEAGGIPSLSGTRRYKLMVDDQDPSNPSLIILPIT